MGRHKKRKRAQYVQHLPHPTTARRKLEEEWVNADSYLSTSGKQPSLPLSKPDQHAWSGGFNKSTQTLLGPAVVAPPCYHRGDIPLFIYGHKTFFPANHRGLDPHTVGADLIIDCAGIVNTAAPHWVKGDEAFQSLNTYFIRPLPRIVRLDWRDFGLPPVGAELEFWQDFLSRLPDGKIVVCCQGGHGRTGTCLAALAIAAGWTAEEAIDLVRTQHCKKAIETKDQERYLHGLQKQKEGSLT